MSDLSINESAVGAHEFYTSYLEAGFSKAQALYLTGLITSPQAPRDIPDE